MLFMITKTRPPETCPEGSDRANSHIEIDGQGIALKGCWEASDHHALWYLVEADDYQAIHHFLEPWMKGGTTTVMPVDELFFRRPIRSRRRVYAFNPPLC